MVINYMLYVREKVLIYYKFYHANIQQFSISLSIYLLYACIIC